MIAYADRNPGRFHVPGHKGGPGADPALREVFGDRLLQLDLPAGIEGIDVGPDPAEMPFALAQRLAAEAWGPGAAGSWSTAARAATTRSAWPSPISASGWWCSATSTPRPSTASCCRPAPSVRGTGARPRARRGALPGPGELDAALADEPDAVAAMIVSPPTSAPSPTSPRSPRSPTRAGVPLVVDEAWGAHMHFSSALPTAALESGADVVLSSSTRSSARSPSRRSSTSAPVIASTSESSTAP